MRTTGKWTFSIPLAVIFVDKMALPVPTEVTVMVQANDAEFVGGSMVGAP